MLDLASLLEQQDVTRYLVSTVSAVQLSEGTVSLQWHTGTVVKVPYLLSYTPTVGDKVHVLSGDSVGILVLGKTAYTAPSVTPTNRTAYLTPNRSMSWDGDPETLGTVGTASEGLVRQGSTVAHLYSGAYVYPSSTVTLASGEMVIKAEMLLARVDVGTPQTVSPVLHALVSFEPSGRPSVTNPELGYMPADMLPGDVIWNVIPLAWATGLIDNTIHGITFEASSAQLALNYSEYASYATVSDVGSSSVAGRIRLTIENS